MNESLKDILGKYKSENALEMLREYAKSEDISFVKPAPIELIDAFEGDTAKFPMDLREIYEFTNGFFKTVKKIV